MTRLDAAEIPWRIPWHPFPPDDACAAKAEAELHREMCPGHILFGRSVVALGYRQDCDDTLFFLGASAPCLAVVHLTYQKETHPEWPETILFDSLTEWVELGMIPDAEDFGSNDNTL